MSLVAAADPFAVTADPDAYVAREASEEALAALERAVREARGPCALTGPVGIGKSLLLRVLERRMGDVYTFVLLPYAALELEDLARWALGVLGRSPAPHADPVAELLRVADRLAAGRGALVLMLDDASALAPDVARALVGLSARSGGALRLLVVPVDDGRAGRVLAALGPETVAVRFRAPLTAAESARFVRERLARADAPADVAERFDDETLSRLHALSAGNPRRLQILAAAVLRGRPLQDLLGDGDPDPDAAEAGADPEAADLEERTVSRREADGPVSGATVAGESRSGRGAATAAAVAAGVVLVFLALVVLVWWLSPTTGPGEDGAAAAAPAPAIEAPPAAPAAAPSPLADPPGVPAGAHTTARSTGADGAATP